MLREPFAEKAEILSDEEVLKSFRAMAVDEQLIRKLLDRSPRVIIGARGSGKSMLMKRALLKSRQDFSEPLCIYVNFSKYLRLEPYVFKQPNAISIFRDWVIGKIFVATVEEAGADADCTNALMRVAGFDTSFSYDLIKSFVERMEGSISSLATLQGGMLPALTVERVIAAIDVLRERQGRVSTVLLMDDAAHAFSPEFQEEFFGVFRLFRTVTLASKAAVYPGATYYGPTFNPGHDALETRVEREVFTNDYESFVDAILKARLARTPYERLASDPEMYAVLCYAASGNPRAAIVMARDVLENAQDKTPRRSDYKDAIDSYCNNTMWKQHESLKLRLPRFESQIYSGQTFVHKLLVPALRQLNGKGRDKQTPFFAVEAGSKTEFITVLSLLEYAGIVQQSKRVIVRRGLRRPLMRYQLNLGIAISQGVFIGAQGAAVPVTPDQLRHLRLKRYKMFTQDSTEIGQLIADTQPTLPPCPKCKKPRVVPDARFCAYCGSELQEGSIFLELLRSPISSLAIPTSHETILQLSGVKTIRDIVMDPEGKRLKELLGLAASRRIRKMAEEFLEG